MFTVTRRIRRDEELHVRHAVKIGIRLPVLFIPSLLDREEYLRTDTTKK